MRVTRWMIVSATVACVTSSVLVSDTLEYLCGVRDAIPREVVTPFAALSIICWLALIALACTREIRTAIREHDDRVTEKINRTVDEVVATRELRKLGVPTGHANGHATGLRTVR